MTGTSGSVAANTAGGQIVQAGDGGVVRYGFQRHPISRDGPSSPAVKAILARYLAAR